jgi:hypothetical protein
MKGRQFDTTVDIEKKVRAQLTSITENEFPKHLSRVLNIIRPEPRLSLGVIFVPIIQFWINCVFLFHPIDIDYKLRILFSLKN